MYAGVYRFANMYATHRRARPRERVRVQKASRKRDVVNRISAHLDVTRADETKEEDSPNQICTRPSCTRFKRYCACSTQPINPRDFFSPIRLPRLFFKKNCASAFAGLDGCRLLILFSVPEFLLRENRFLNDFRSWGHCAVSFFELEISSKKFLEF